jgi:imidazolonepropionase-like amidohydrolase
MMNQLGTIEEGKIANLLIVDENPLVELSSLEESDLCFCQGAKIEQRDFGFF